MQKMSLIMFLILGFAITNLALAGTRTCTEESDARARTAAAVAAPVEEEPDAEDLAAQIQLLRAELREVKAILKTLLDQAPTRNNEAPQKPARRSGSSRIADC